MQPLRVPTPQAFLSLTLRFTVALISLSAHIVHLVPPSFRTPVNTVLGVSINSACKGLLWDRFGTSSAGVRCGE
ncbi:hypothetical protein IG631_01971 [Alternaria alternata]|nr:hypothetical protein IG631_01971 [Alternaria alternata]